MTKKSSPFLLVTLVLFLGNNFLPKKNLPQELTWVYESLNSQKLSTDESEQYRNYTKRLDTSLKRMTEKRALFVIKAEIYKSVLEYGKGLPNRYPKMKSAYIDQLRVRFNKNTRKYDDFSRWLLLSITNDLKKLVTSPEFLTLENQKAPTPSAIKLKTKLSLINPLVFLLLSTPPETFNFLINPLKLRILRNLADLTDHLVSFSKNSKDALLISKSSFNTTTENNMKKTQKKEMTFLDDKESDFDSLPEPTPLALDDWSPSEKDLEVLSNAGKIPEKKRAPIPFYTPDPKFTPFVVPTPVNDWKSPK